MALLAKVKAKMTKGDSSTNLIEVQEASDLRRMSKASSGSSLGPSPSARYRNKVGDEDGSFASGSGALSKRLSAARLSQSLESPVSAKRGSVHSTLEAAFAPDSSVGSKRGSFGKIRKSLQKLMILGPSIGQGDAKASKPDFGKDIRQLPELAIPKPTLPGVGVAVGLRRPSSTPEMWDMDGIPTPGSQLHFDRFRKAKTVLLSPDLHCATVRGQMFGGVVVGLQQLKKTPSGRFYEVIIEEVDDEEILIDGNRERRWRSGMGIGFTTHAGDHTFPKLDAEEMQTYGCECLPDSWLVGYDGRAMLQGKSKFLKGNDLPKGPWTPRDLVAGDKVGVLATEEGHILIFVNGEHRCVVPYCDIPWRPSLFPCIDLDGCTVTVRLVDKNDDKIPNYIADKKAHVCRKLAFQTKQT